MMNNDSFSLFYLCSITTTLKQQFIDCKEHNIQHSITF